MPLPKSRIFLLVCLFAVIGLGYGYRLPWTWLAVLAMVCIIVGTVGQGSRLAWAGALVGLGFAGSAMWADSQSPPDMSGIFGQELPMVVRIDDDPSLREKSLSFLGTALEIDGQKTSVPVAVVLMRYPVYEYGTRLELVGEMEVETEFNRKDNVSGQLVFPDINKAEPGHGQAWRLWLYRLKHELLEKIGSLLPEPHSGLLAGLLLGTRNMPPELLEQFRVTGTSHIVAVSGFNVTIVAGFLDAIFRRFGRSLSFYTSVVAIFGFVIITGASASVVRAGLMGVLVLLAQHTGRMYASVNSIMLAGLVMLLGNPKLLVFDIGFQLSFAALAGLLLVHPKLEEWLPYRNWVTAAIYPTVSAQITTAPLILYHFGNLSIVSVLTNFLILPMIPLAMLTGFFMLLAGYALPFLGTVSGLLTWAVLEYVIRMVDWTARIPSAALDGLPFPLWAMVLYYLVLGAILKWKPKPRTS